MQHLLALALVLALAAPGCARDRTKGREASWPSIDGQKTIVTSGMVLVGKVARVNAGARIAVLSFPIGHLPSLDQRLNVYRQGLKIGEIKVTGPQLDDKIVGDILAGEAQAGDEVRDR